MPSELRVRANTLFFQEKSYRCAIGRGGLIGAEQKCEGDGCTPIGTWALRECWYRADRMDAPQTSLPLRIITQADGWCDDPKHAEYNRHIIIPPPTEEGISFERLWREEAVYDLIIPLGYNDDRIIPGKGSAIFLHVARENYEPTEGCVALARQDLLEILPSLRPESTITIATN